MAHFMWMEVLDGYFIIFSLVFCKSDILHDDPKKLRNFTLLAVNMTSDMKLLGSCFPLMICRSSEPVGGVIFKGNINFNTVILINHLLSVALNFFISHIHI